MTWTLRTATGKKRTGPSWEEAKLTLVEPTGTLYTARPPVPEHDAKLLPFSKKLYSWNSPGLQLVRTIPVRVDQGCRDEDLQVKRHPGF